MEFPTGAVPKFCSECGAALTITSRLSETGNAADAFRSSPESTAWQTHSAIDPNTVTQQPATRAGGSTPDETGQPFDKSVGPYRLVRELGRGGMGSVYEAIHHQTGQSVALKLLLPTLQGTEESVHRFRRESQIAASINHPRSTFVYEAGQHQEQFYITMELMKGGTLKDVVARNGPLEVGQAVDYILDIVDGLTVAHAAGIVHRDIKPSNCFLDLNGRAKIGDFGLAKSFLGDVQLTQTGAFMGTPQYAAPEQLRASDVDERTDIYAIGATLFYLLTGRPSFTGNPAQVIAGIASETPPDVRKFAANVPRPLARMIAQMMEKDPEKRPQKLELLSHSLLPYASSGASLADMGRRLAAFFIDLSIAGAIASVVTISTALLASVNGNSLPGLLDNPQSPFLAVTFSVVCLIAYFAICEHLWGRGVGKWFLGMRVIGKNLESPNYSAAIIRATIVPGLPWLLSLLGQMILAPGSPTGLEQALNQLGMAQLLSLLSWILVMICMMTARRTNGYRGIHGLVSGTRVVRLSGELEIRRINSIPITTPLQLAPHQPKSFGPYKTVGCFNEQRTPNIYLGNDPVLDRDVWIFKDIPSDSLSDARRSSTRASRLRVLHDGNLNSQNWYVTEAVKGMPLVEIIHRSEFVWTTVRPLLLELALELNNAMARDTMPTRLGIDHVWIDDMGRIKLLDFAVGPSRSLDPDSNPPATEPSLQNPQNQLFLTLLGKFLEHHEAPLHVRKMQANLLALANEETMLTTAISDLNQFADRASTWNWDDRLGVLAITSGFELGLMSALICFSGLACIALNFQFLAIFLTTATTGSLAAYLLGYYFRGGPAFQIADVAVLRSQTFQAASRTRSAIRNWLAWLPLILAGSVFFFWTLEMMEQTFADSQGMQRDPSDSAPFAILLLASFAMLSFTTALNLLVDLLSPARGITDFLTGTRLARK